MTQTVYADVLFFVNFVIDLLIMLSASLFTKQRYSVWQYIVMSVISALYSCFAFYSDIPQWAVTPLSFILYFLMLRFIANCKGKKLLKTFIATITCSVCYGGSILLLYLFTGFGSVAVFNNGALYIDIPVFALLIFSFISFSLIWLFSKIYNYVHPKNCKVGVELELFDNRISLTGIIDSGNTLKEPISGLPVAICYINTLQEFLPPNRIDILQSDAEMVRYGVRLVPYNTVNGKGILRAVKVKIYLKLKDQTREIKDIYLALSKEKIIGENTILLPAEIMELGEILYVIPNTEGVFTTKKTV